MRVVYNHGGLVWCSEGVREEPAGIQHVHRIWTLAHPCSYGHCRCILQEPFVQVRENNWAVHYRHKRAFVTYDL